MCDHLLHSRGHAKLDQACALQHLLRKQPFLHIVFIYFFFHKVVRSLNIIVHSFLIPIHTLLLYKCFFKRSTTLTNR